MGSKLYDFLTDSFLFDDSLIEEQFASITEKEIRIELRRYREFWLSNAAEIESEVQANDSQLKMFSGLKKVRPALLKQTSLYVEQHILYDPLFDLGRERNPDEDAFNAVFGLRSPSLDKEEVQESVRYLKALTPMVTSNYVKFFPTSRFFEPLQPIPMRYSKSGFAESVPAELFDFFHANAHVTTARPEGTSITFGWPLEIGRGIAVNFKEQPPDRAEIYFLADQEIDSIDRRNGSFSTSISMPVALPTPERFNSWVSQSINQTAGHVYRRLCLEVDLADSFGAGYLSNSQFAFRLIEQIGPVQDGIQTNTVNALLNFDLPFLDKIDIDTLMTVRRDDGEAFADFRLELDKQLRTLRGIIDPDELKRKTEEVFHELTEVQISRIDRKITSLKKQVLLDVVIATGSLMGAIQTGGFSVLMGAMAALHGYRSYSQYQSEKKENPAFFLWKASKGQ
ncbi:MAG: hypothetical protein AABN95_02365 [Acidobacteriota bacterium]